MLVLDRVEDPLKPLWLNPETHRSLKLQSTSSMDSGSGFWFCTNFAVEALIPGRAETRVASNPVFAKSSVSAGLRLAGIAVCRTEQVQFGWEQNSTRQEPRTQNPEADSEQS